MKFLGTNEEKGLLSSLQHKQEIYTLVNELWQKQKDLRDALLKWDENQSLEDSSSFLGSVGSSLSSVSAEA